MMNPGLLNKRLVFCKRNIVNGNEQEEQLFTTWGQKVIKTKRRDEEQNHENYEFIIRKRLIEEYSYFNCEGQFFDVITVEEKEKGYYTLKCEKAHIHNFKDSTVVKRLAWIENQDHEDVPGLIDIYVDVPCQLIRNNDGGTNETEQQNEIDQRFILQLETKYNLKIGDTLEVQHKQDSYEFTVMEFFRYHTFQEVRLKLEREA